jgi:hypothetical protein
MARVSYPRRWEVGGTRVYQVKLSDALVGSNVCDRDAHLPVTNS